MGRHSSRIFILQVISSTSSRPRPTPRVLLVLDEATNANLVGAAGHEVRALAECQKMGLDIHILVQSLNFPNSQIADGVLTIEVIEGKLGNVTVTGNKFYCESFIRSQRGVSEPNLRTVAFTVRQLLDMLSPSNVPWLNPEVIEAIQKTGGRNLIEGVRRKGIEQKTGTVRYDTGR